MTFLTNRIKGKHESIMMEFERACELIEESRIDMKKIGEVLSLIDDIEDKHPDYYSTLDSMKTEQEKSIQKIAEAKASLEKIQILQQGIMIKIYLWVTKISNNRS